MAGMLLSELQHACRLPGATAGACCKQQSCGAQSWRSTHMWSQSQDVRLVRRLLRWLGGQCPKQGGRRQPEIALRSVLWDRRGDTFGGGSIICWARCCNDCWTGLGNHAACPFWHTSAVSLD